MASFIDLTVKPTPCGPLTCEAAAQSCRRAEPGSEGVKTHTGCSASPSAISLRGSRSLPPAPASIRREQVEASFRRKGPHLLIRPGKGGEEKLQGGRSTSFDMS